MEITQYSVYRIAKGRRIYDYLAAGIAFLLGLMLPFIANAADKTPLSPLEIGICILFDIPILFLSWLFLLAALVRLIISQDGITYSTSLYKIYISWDNISCIENKWMALQSPEVLILNEPPIIMNKFLPESIIRWMFKRAYSSDKCFPLGPYVFRFRGSGLEADIKRFAPHLFL